MFPFQRIPCRGTQGFRANRLANLLCANLLARGYRAGYQRLDTGDGATCRNTPKAGDFLGGRAKAAIPAFLCA
ncbi:hypothetical protein SAMN04244574_01762 [Azotobacter beijerinckii]|uniref:Uncharacterized protein n=1 Tax=Azotobacter beijerinckii TaxID=170623 RepID=A0A1I4C5G5_9GAMM|nr:hypothetical protein SAMN04244571_03984 [Azotobacter beijerinckii]SFK75406.1 hypothetical protein SAMN04244574_01762 [Azotobacter beijerinckii]